jgi:hypothetical protein
VLTGHNWTSIVGAWQARYDTQATPEVLAVWMLDPRTQRAPVELEEAHRVIHFLQRHATNQSPQSHDILERHFWEFRQGFGIFHPSNYAEGLLKDPRTYWTQVQATVAHCTLATLALRLLDCLANSVPSERSFSS